MDRFFLADQSAICCACELIVFRKSNIARSVVLILIVCAAFVVGTRYQEHRPQIREFLAGFKAYLLSKNLDRPAAEAQTPSSRLAALAPVELPATAAESVPTIKLSVAAPAPAPRIELPAAAPVAPLELPGAAATPAPAVESPVAVLAPEPKIELPAPAAPGPKSRRTLETSLLPLVVDTVAIPRPVGVHVGFGGGITVVNDIIVIVDLKGAFFTVEAKGDKIEKLALPALPNHLEDYDKFARKPLRIPDFLVNTGFRVHDVESRKEPGGIRLFVSYERYLPELNTTALAVSTILLGAKDLSPLGPWQDIYQSHPLVAEWYSGVGGGGRMVAHGESLYLTVGDYNQDNVFMSSRLEAQNPDNDFGKIFKIDLRTQEKHLVSMGHRNPQGLVITSKGTMYATEHGPRGGDKLNVIAAGRNYGWPVTTLGTHYSTYDWPNRHRQTAEQRFEKPVFAWVPSIAVSNLIEIVNFNPAWDNDLLVESLKAQSLYRLRLDGEGRVVYSEPIALGQRLRDIAALSDGTLVLWTDEAQLMFLSVDSAKLATNKRAVQ